MAEVELGFELQREPGLVLGGGQAFLVVQAERQEGVGAGMIRVLGQGLAQTLDRAL